MLTLIAVGVVVDVFLRAMFSAPFRGLSEFVSLAAAVTVATFLPLSLYEGGHAKIRLLGGLLGARAERWLERFAALLTLVFFAALTWQFWLYATDLYAISERTWILGISVGPWWIATAGLMGLSTVAQFASLLLSFSNYSAQPAG
ncbi:MAG: TRAP transporter small permease [Mesorhizobium sp.]|nr:TRAP transporter small permease [Mesorhizobium sp.]